MDRREFLCASGVAALQFPFSDSWDRELRVISKHASLYHGWPTITRRRNGQLVLVCSGGRDEHVCPFGRVEYMTSSDDGKTWSWPRVILDGPIDDRDAGVMETSKGTLLVTSFSSLAYEATLVQAEKSPSSWPKARLVRWRSAHARADAAQRKQALGVWMIRSTDGGLTWSRRYDSIVNSPHGPIELSDKRLLYAGIRLWQGRRVGVCISVDDGLTWKWLAEIPTRGGDRHQDYHELHAVETSGRIVVHIRNHNRTNYRETLQCHSSDGGKTWSKPRSIGVWGLPSHLLKLRDGRLLMSYGHRRKPFGNLARLSEDGGATWSKPLTISDDGAGGDLGYPSTVQVADGSLVSVWYESMKGRAKAILRQARWRLP
jgi:Neuraminidase (sialidase)